MTKEHNNNSSQLISNIDLHLGQDGDPGGPELLCEDELLLALHVHILDRVGGHRDHLINGNQVLNVTLDGHDQDCFLCPV